MNTYGLDPENIHTCWHCQHTFLEMGFGLKCDLHTGRDIRSIINEVNDCGDWKSPYLSDYRRRTDLEGELKRKGGTR